MGKKIECAGAQALPPSPGLSRREVLGYGFAAVGMMMTGPTFLGCGDSPMIRVNAGDRRRVSNIADLGPLGEPDENGVRLPSGFSARVVARSGVEPVPGSGYRWHGAPDGGATFATADGGWIYVSNSELPSLGGLSGGVGALRFDAGGNLIDAYSILSGTNLNCAGGPTPWGTWLSCEEFDNGQVWECDPAGQRAGILRPALGTFQHEAVAVDLPHQQLFLTEDRGDGRFYRFTPAALTADGFPDLSAGVLEVARVIGGEEGPVEWLAVPDPSGRPTPTRLQLPESTSFRGGEGIWYHAGIVYFSTKGDNRVWAYDTNEGTVRIFYDDDFFDTPVLTGVDNVTVSPAGDVLVAEDGGDMQVVAITPSGVILPIVQVEGHERSEVTGPALDPSGRRLYFSSQRGTSNNPLKGVTFEISGPFFRDA